VDDSYTRTQVHRFVVIVDRAGCIIASEGAPDHSSLMQYGGRELPQTVRALARACENRRKTYLLDSGCVVHVVPILGTPSDLRALVFEEVRLRAEL
jgi:hypothetical protein